MSFAGNKEFLATEKKNPTKPLSNIECLNTKTSSGFPAKQCTALRDN